jgi:hypothetical protein
VFQVIGMADSCTVIHRDHLLILSRGSAT